MLTWKKALRASALGTFTALTYADTWRDIGAGIFAVSVQLLRILLLVLFPVTIPLFAWLIIRDTKRRAEEEPKRRAALRAGIHKNGPLE